MNVNVSPAGKLGSNTWSSAATPRSRRPANIPANSVPTPIVTITSRPTNRRALRASPRRSPEHCLTVHDVSSRPVLRRFDGRDWRFSCLRCCSRPSRQPHTAEASRPGDQLKSALDSAGRLGVAGALIGFGLGFELRRRGYKRIRRQRSGERGLPAAADGFFGLLGVDWHVDRIRHRLCSWLDR